ncbi:MAG TPA: ABC transporter permease [Chloroflexota bacterium]|nr:ABC transporter permease [Chloroflexota bacterium]
MDFSYLTNNPGTVLAALGQHIEITALTLAIAIVIAVPLGTLIARISILYTPVLGILGIIYTIPSFALLGFLIQYVGIGIRSSLVALVAYAQFMLVLSVATGLRGVDSAVIDAGRGMGMTDRQILFRIEYPLALPVMVAGLRVATVATIAIASVAALDDAGGLGALLFDGINNSFASTSEVQVGAIAVSLLAIAADLLLRAAQRAVPAARAG